MEQAVFSAAVYWREAPGEGPEVMGDGTDRFIVIGGIVTSAVEATANGVLVSNGSCDVGPVTCDE